MPKKEAMMMKRKEARLTVNMIWSCVSGIGIAVATYGMILVASFAATVPLHQNEPMNSNSPPSKTRRSKGAASLP